MGIIKGDIVKTPCIGVSLPIKIKKKSGNVKYFTQEQVDMICEKSVAMHSNGELIYRLGHAVIVLIYTGMRIGELLGLKWEFINFDKKTARVTDSVVLVKNRDKEDDNSPKYKLLEQESVKTASGDRIIYLNQKAISALRQLQQINGKQKSVMASKNGRVMMPRNFNRMLEGVLLRCGLESSGAHTLRHTYASMLFKNGVDVKTVSELLGHSDVGVTYNTYIHLVKEQKQQAVNILDTL